MKNFDKDELKNNPLFQGLSNQQFERFWCLLAPQLREHPRGSVLFCQGDIISHLGLVAEGILRTERTAPNGRKMLLSDEVAPGELLCASFATVPGQPLSYSVHAHTDCLVHHIDCHRLLSLGQQGYGRILINLLSIVNEQSIYMTRKSIVFSTGSTRERISLYLFDRYHRYGNPRFLIPLNREELASYLGADRSALSKELSAMQREGLLLFHKNDFEILPPLLAYYDTLPY